MASLKQNKHAMTCGNSLRLYDATESHTMKQNTKISGINKYNKFYFVFEHNGVKKYYRGPSAGLEVTENPDTGELVPLNPIQETRQVLNKELYAGLKKFRADLKLYVEAYWDLVPYPTLAELTQRQQWRPDTSFPKELITITEDVKFDILKHIKRNAWERSTTYINNRHTTVYTIVDDKERLVRNALARFTKAIYKKFKHLHTREDVPLGEMTPEDQY